MHGSIPTNLSLIIGNVSLQVLVLFLIYSFIVISSSIVGISLLNRLTCRLRTSFGVDEIEMMFPLYMAVGLSAMMMVTFLVSWLMPVYKAGWFLLAVFLIPILSWKSIKKYRFHLKPLLLLFAIAFLLGFYHYGLKGLTLGEYYIIPGFYSGDLEIHKMYADMIWLFGLPLQDPTGVSEFANNRIGIQLMSVFFAATFHMPILLCMQGVAISFYFLLVSSIRSILVALWPDENRWKINLISITPLIWGGTFSLFVDAIYHNWRGLIFPYVFSKIRLLPSGSLYHNMTQAGSVALSSSSVLAILLYMKIKKVNMHTIALALLCVGGLCKPSLIVVLAPALALLHLSDKDYGAFKRLLIMSAVFIVINMALQFTATTGQSHGDALVFDPLHKLFQPGIRSLVIAYLNTCLMIVFVIYAAYKWLTFREDISARLSSFLSVAFLGALAFSLMFHQANTGVGNELWGLLGVSILIVPVFILSMLQGVSNYYKKLVIILSIITITSGIIYAICFPTGNIETIDAKVAHDLKQFGKTCDVSATLALDPELGENRFTASLTGRKTLLERKILSDFDSVLRPSYDPLRSTLSQLKWFLNMPCDSYYEKTDLIKRDYLIVASKRAKAIIYMQQHNFIIKDTLDCGAIVLKNNSHGKD